MSVEIGVIGVLVLLMALWQRVMARRIARAEAKAWYCQRRLEAAEWTCQQYFEIAEEMSDAMRVRTQMKERVEALAKNGLLPVRVMTRVM